MKYTWSQETLNSYKELIVKINKEEMLNHLLKSIVEANGGTVKSEGKNALLKSWLEAIGG